MGFNWRRLHHVEDVVWSFVSTLSRSKVVTLDMEMTLDGGFRDGRVLTKGGYVKAQEGMKEA